MPSFINPKTEPGMPRIGEYFTNKHMEGLNIWLGEDVNIETFYPREMECQMVGFIRNYATKEVEIVFRMLNPGDAVEPLFPIGMSPKDIATFHEHWVLAPIDKEIVNV